jgi:small-conductance mechanosensitive channel
MNENTVASSKLLVELLSGDGLNEMIAILIVIAIAIISGRLAKAGLVRIGSDVMVRPWTGRLIETAVILTPYLVAALLIGLAENTARQFGMAYNVLVLTSQLVVALGVVRIAVYCLRLLLGDTSLVARWEARITLVLWLGLGFELLGWFNWLEETLDAIDLLPGKSVFSLWALLKGLIVITAFVVITSVIARAIERRVMLLETLAPSTRVGISKFTYFLLISLGILLGINSAGVDLTALTVLTGAIVFGLGFGIRDITANFVSGFVLLMDKSIKPGDVISFTQHTGTTSENFGWVQELRGRYVVVRDRDGVESLVPNQNLITTSVINWSYSDQRVRLRLPVMISYDDDPELALQLLVKAASDHPRILRDPEPVSRLLAFENYGIRLESRFWIRDPMNGVNNVRSDVNRRIWKLFKEAGIKIPVAQQEVRVLGPVGEHADPRG